MDEDERVAAVITALPAVGFLIAYMVKPDVPLAVLGFIFSLWWALGWQENW